MNNNFVNCPIALGMVPDKQFPWRYSLINPVKYPMSGDMYPLWLFGRRTILVTVPLPSQTTPIHVHSDPGLPEHGQPGRLKAEPTRHITAN
jgi:hypothetical protein